MSATDAGIQKKIFGSGMTLIISNEEMNGTMKIVKSFKKPGLFNKVVSETINNKKKKNKKVDFLTCYYVR